MSGSHDGSGNSARSGWTLLHVDFRCPWCDFALTVSGEQVDAHIRCPRCRAVVGVPAVSASAVEPGPGSRNGRALSTEWRARCLQCHKKIRVPYAYFGKWIRCPRCSHRMKTGLVSEEKPTPHRSSADAGAVPHVPAAVPAIAVEDVASNEETDRPTFTPRARSDASGRCAAPRPPDAIPVGPAPKPQSTIPVSHPQPASSPAIGPAQAITDTVEVEAVETVERIEATEAVEPELPEPIYYKPHRHGPKDDRPSAVGLSPYTTHLSLYIAFRWVIPSLLILIMAAAMPAAPGSISSALAFLGLIAGAFVFLPVLPDSLARSLTAVISTSYECPGCHEVYEAVDRWGCACGYQDYRERHFILMTCELCGARPGWSNCRRCGATIFLQKGRLPKDRDRE